MVCARLCARLSRCHHTQVLKGFVLKHFLVLTEVVAVVLAFAFPAAGAKVSHPIVSLCIVAVIFLFAGLKMKTDELKAATKRLDVVVICVLSSLFITSLVPSLIVDQLPFDAPNATNSSITDRFSFGPTELKLGAILFHCAPCTIATGIIMVGESVGDVVVAVSVSTIANLLGCFSTPFLFSLFVEIEGAMSQASGDIIKKLGLSLLLPLFVGKLLSTFIPPVKRTVAKYKRALGLLQSLGICLILWIKLSKSIYTGTFQLVRITDILLVCVLMIVLHFLLLLFNFILSLSFCFTRRSASVILLLVSQKTLVLTAAVATTLPPEIGDPALILLPCFIGHPLQMLIDSFFVHPLRTSNIFPLCLPQFCVSCREKEEETPAGPAGEKYDVVESSKSSEKSNVKSDGSSVSERKEVPMRRHEELAVWG